MSCYRGIPAEVETHKSKVVLTITTDWSRSRSRFGGQSRTLAVVKTNSEKEISTILVHISFECSSTASDVLVWFTARGDGCRLQDQHIRHQPRSKVGGSHPCCFQFNTAVMEKDVSVRPADMRHPLQSRLLDHSQELHRRRKERMLM